MNKNDDLKSLLDVFIMSVSPDHQSVFKNVGEIVLKEINERYNLNCEQSYGGQFFFRAKNYILVVTPHQNKINFNKRIYIPKMEDASYDTSIFKHITGEHKRLYKKRIKEYEEKIIEAHDEIMNNDFVKDLLKSGYSIWLGNDINKLIKNRDC